MSLFAKILNIVTPYKRTFLTVELEPKRHLILPARNSAVCFLQREDLFNLNYAEIDSVSFLDYDLINSVEEYRNNFNSFKEYIKEVNYESQEAMFVMDGRMVKNSVIIIYLKATTR
ncbi:hypothetical protein NWE55_16855 (plasmid) [Myroides albus]|uniref:Uncharacterized protein n=1 Tax=Myroides odoratimimus TaxID=76832 RepID=A0AAI8C987_9FLAO|nr:MULTISPECIES: hypothetical protein [Myroides]ALU28493.1 hypothetical protein AS202_20150 [Myroides odoratimimus]UVD81342.1 hypothetical protein NWE55_16855 [Myroides albus]